MGKKKKNKQVELHYEFDRLGFKKMSMVYALLVPLLDEAAQVVHSINKTDEISWHMPNYINIKYQQNGYSEMRAIVVPF